MPPVETDEIRNVVCDDVRRHVLLSRPHYVDRNARIERCMLFHTPRATNIIFQPCSTDCWVLLISVAIDLEFSFPIPAHVVVEYANPYRRAQESPGTFEAVRNDEVALQGCGILASERYVQVACFG